MKKKLFFMIPVILLVFAVLFSCGEGELVPGGGEDENPVDPVLSGVPLPMFTRHPTSVDYQIGASAVPLKVEATIREGELSYQWFEVNSFVNTGGTAITNETNPEFTPSTAAEGSKFYYARVTNTLTIYEDPKKCGVCLECLEEQTCTVNTEPVETGKETRSNNSNPARIRVLTSTPSAPTEIITVGTTQVQYVRGFGGMSNAFWIGPQGQARYMELRDIDTMFHPETGLGYKILRIHIFPHPVSEILRGQHYPQMGNQLYARIVQRVNEYGGFVMASPWTPPAEYKTNNSTLGSGKLRTDRYADYARYLRNFGLDMAERGAPLYAISIQNEPTHEADYYGMLWEPPDHLRFVRDFGDIFHFGADNTRIPGFGGGVAAPVKLMGGSPHNNIEWNNSVLNDATARPKMDIVAYHTYGNLNIRYPLARQLPDRKEIWMTEKNHNSGSEATYHNDYTWNYVWHVVNEINHSLTEVDASAFVWWYAKRFYSMIGEGAYGTINGSVLPRGWGMSHYAKYATDTVRLETTDTLSKDIIGQDTIRGRRFGISAYIRKATPNLNDFEEAKLETLEDSISLVIYDRHTTAGGSTDIRISLPAGFTATNAYGIISNGTVYHAPVVVVLGPDGSYGDINLPANSIISVKFVK